MPTSRRSARSASDVDVAWGTRNILANPATHQAFRMGDEIVLSAGSYVGTTGVFLRLRPDAKWADVCEHSGANRSHPVEWLACRLFPIRASGAEPLSGIRPSD